MVFLFFCFLRNVHTAFHNGWTNLHSHQQCRRLLCSPQPHKHLLLFVFWMVAILTGVWWYLIVVLICISLVTNNVEHLFVCLLAAWISSLENCLFRPSPLCVHIVFKLCHSFLDASVLTLIAFEIMRLSLVIRACSWKGEAFPYGNWGKAAGCFCLYGGEHLCLCCSLWAP